MIRLVPVMAWCAVIWWLSSQPATDSSPPFPHFDKLLHALEFGILGGLIVRCFERRFSDNLGRAALIAWALALAYGVIDEVHQMFVPTRHADPLDALADAVGAAVALAIWFSIRRARAG